MGSKVEKITARLLLVLFSAVVFGGEGLHHLPVLGLHGCPPASAEPAGCNPAASKSPCCHARRPAPDTQPIGSRTVSRDKRGEAPCHDEDCSICRFFGQAKLVSCSQSHDWQRLPTAPSLMAPAPVYVRHIFEPYAARDPPMAAFAS